MIVLSTRIDSLLGGRQATLLWQLIVFQTKQFKPLLLCLSTAARAFLWNHSTMGLNIEDGETEKLAIEIAKLAGESEEEAVRQALLERRERLRSRPGAKGRRPRTKEELLHFMETEIWPLIPERNRGGPPITKEEKEEILGYGPEGF